MLISWHLVLLIGFACSSQAEFIEEVDPPTSSEADPLAEKRPIHVDPLLLRDQRQKNMCFYTPEDDQDLLPDPMVHGQNCVHCVNVTRVLYKADFSVSHMHMSLYRLIRFLCKDLPRKESLTQCYERHDNVTEEQLLQLFVGDNLPQTSFATCHLFNICDVLSCPGQEESPSSNQLDSMENVRYNVSQDEGTADQSNVIVPAETRSIRVDTVFLKDHENSNMCIEAQTPDLMPDPMVHGEDCLRCVNMTRTLLKANFVLGHMRMGLFKINRIACRNFTRSEPVDRCYDAMDGLSDEQLFQLYIGDGLARSSFAACHILDFCNPTRCSNGANSGSSHLQSSSSWQYSIAKLFTLIGFSYFAFRSSFLN